MTAQIPKNGSDCDEEKNNFVFEKYFARDRADFFCSVRSLGQSFIRVGRRAGSIFQGKSYVVDGAGRINPGHFGLFPHHLRFKSGRGVRNFAESKNFFLLVGATLLILAAYFYPKLKKTDRILKFGATILVGGATANLIDRAQSGQVTDFIDFRVWPVFNIADVAIVLGMFVMIYAILFKVEESGKIQSVRR